MILFKKKKKKKLDKRAVGIRIKNYEKLDNVDGSALNDFLFSEEENLYISICAMCFNLIGQDNSWSVKKRRLISYANKIFQIDTEKATILSHIVNTTELPMEIVTVDILEAENLPSMDANGFSDPFCVMWLSSKPTEWVKSTIKQKTLNPVWNETYYLKTSSTKRNIFNLSVWDSDANESISDIMKKIKDIRTSFWAVKKYLHELKQATLKKFCNEFIGSLQISLSKIPSCGQLQWYKLVGSNKIAVGNILLRLKFGSEKSNTEALYEHKILLEKIITEHIEKSEDKMWQGEFCPEAQIILRQHSIRGNLSNGQELITKWATFTSQSHYERLHPPLVADLSDKIVLCRRNETFTDEMDNVFWETTKPFLLSCFNFIKNIGNLGRKENAVELESMLRILNNLQLYNNLTMVDLFPVDTYDWITAEAKSDILDVLRDAIITGACDWFEELSKNQTAHWQKNNLEKLKTNVELIVKINQDLESAWEYNEEIFNKCVQCRYNEILFSVYQNLIVQIVKPSVLLTCLMMKPLRFLERESSYYILQATCLFELYLELEKLYKIGSKIIGNKLKMATFQISDFRNWFIPATARWLDITVHKAKCWITKAINLEEFVQLDEMIKVTCSAVDTMFTLCEMKIAWKQMQHLDGLYKVTFIISVIEAVSSCSIFYVNRLEAELSETTTEEDKCHLIDKWCLIANDINYVRKNVVPFVEEMASEETEINQLCNNNSNNEPSNYLVRIFVNKLSANIHQQLTAVLAELIGKVLSPVAVFLWKSANSLHLCSNHLDELMDYLEKSLIHLEGSLDFEIFEPVPNTMWTMLCEMLTGTAEKGINTRKSAKFFSNLHRILEIFNEYFKLNVYKEARVAFENQLISRIKFYAMKTSDLIYQYYLDRYKEQNTIKTAADGVLAVRVTKDCDKLSIEVLNARDLKPMDSNGFCDPFVTVRLLPYSQFERITFKTKVARKTLYPLFDEEFSAQLTHEQQQSLQDAIIIFLVEDEDFCGMRNDYVAECYLPLKEAFSRNGQQILLNLSRPSHTDSEIFHVLRNREQNDLAAKNFIRAEKLKMNANR